MLEIRHFHLFYCDLLAKWFAITSVNDQQWTKRRQKNGVNRNSLANYLEETNEEQAIAGDVAMRVRVHKTVRFALNVKVMLMLLVYEPATFFLVCRNC